MPLDQLARRYADELFTRDMERKVREQQQKRVEVRKDHASRGMTMSGGYVAAEATIQAETIRRLAEARAEGLLSAYERAGVPFDDVALNEINEEISQFCTQQKGHAATSLHQFVAQVFGSNAPPNLSRSVIAQTDAVVNAASADIARNLRIRRYEIAFAERRAGKVNAADLGKKWDVFISHASEDKDGFVRPLAEALTKSGLSVWYDEMTLKIGDSLRRAIDQGLAHSQYGVVVLSHSFFSKEWPQQELDGLFTREVEGVKVILPIWHNITAEEVRRYSPILAGRLAANSKAGLDMVVRQLKEAMTTGDGACSST
jgi:hypothetical protein